MAMGSISGISCGIYSFIRRRRTNFYAFNKRRYFKEIDLHRNTKIALERLISVFTLKNILRTPNLWETFKYFVITFVLRIKSIIGKRRH
jgi:hypothetical protein